MTHLIRTVKGAQVKSYTKAEVDALIDAVNAAIDALDSFDPELTVTATDAPAILNINSGGTTGNMDARIRFRDDSVTRWNVRYDESQDALQFRRHDTGGVFADTPLTLDGATGEAELVTWKVGEWQSWTPTWTNVTQGTGATNVGRYCWVPGGMLINLTLILGTGGAFTGQPYFTLPDSAVTSDVNLSGNNPRVVIGGYYRDQSAGDWYNAIAQAGSNKTDLFLNVANGEIGSGGFQVNATTPFTWTNADQVNLTGMVPTT